MTKWRSHIQPDKEEFKETVILPPEGGDEPEELKETVILSPEGSRKDTVSSPLKENQSHEDDSLEETVILKPKNTEKKGKDGT